MSADSRQPAELPKPAESFDLPCPECHQLTDSLKCYRTFVGVYLLLAIWWRAKNVVACPRCMRGKLAEFAGVNLVTMHVAWPIAILPATVAYSIGRRSAGHSTKVLEQVRSGIFGAELAATATRLLDDRREKKPVASRFFGVFKIFITPWALVGAAAALAFEWYYLDFPTRVAATLGLAALAGVVVAGFWSGINNLRLRKTSWATWASLAAAGAVLMGTAQPMLAKLYWVSLERDRAKSAMSGTMYGYADLPADVWQIEPLTSVANAWIDRAENEPGTYALHELERILRTLEAHRADDPEFQPLIEKVRKVVRAGQPGADGRPTLPRGDEKTAEKATTPSPWGDKGNATPSAPSDADKK